MEQVRVILKSIPSVVYKMPTRPVRHTGGEEECSFWLQVYAPARPIRRIAGLTRLYSGRRLVEEVKTPPAFWTSRVVPLDRAGRPGLYFLRFHMPDAGGIDRLTFTLDVVVGRGVHRRRLSLPVRRYEPTVSMRLPIEGGVYVLADHRARHGAEAGWFALDLLGLDPSGMLARREPPREPADFCGLGRRVLAPAAGVVVRLADGMPDHERLGEDTDKAEQIRCLARRDWLLFGNHVVLCHGRGLYSLCAHLARGSVRVEPARKVAAGEEIGRLGNSGFSRMPHLHFQLMTSADAFTAGPIPAWFDNIRIPPFGRFRRAVLHAGTTAFDAAGQGRDA